MYRQATYGPCSSSLWSIEEVSPQHKSCDCADQCNAKTSTVHGCSRQPDLKLSSYTFSLLSFLFLFFSIYLYYFLPFFFCIIFDVPLLSISISSTSQHMFCCIFLYFNSNKAKGRISKQVFQENKAYQIFQKTKMCSLILMSLTVFPLHCSIYFVLPHLSSLIVLIVFCPISSQSFLYIFLDLLLD